MTNHPNAMRGPWLTPGITERLTELHAVVGIAELSMSRIAARLNDEFGTRITSNAVIGRCRRIGLPQRPPWPPKSNKVAKPRKRKHRPRKRLVVELMPIEPPETPPAAPGVAQRRRVTIYQLNDRNCHWPLGPVDDRPPYFFCGKPAVREGCPWCAEHYALTHVVARERVAA
jgi:hypothetical protein